MQLFGEFWYDKKSPPAPDLLRFEYVTEYVITYIQDVTAASANHLREHITRSYKTNNSVQCFVRRIMVRFDFKFKSQTTRMIDLEFFFIAEACICLAVKLTCMRQSQ